MTDTDSSHKYFCKNSLMYAHAFNVEWKEIFLLKYIILSEKSIKVNNWHSLFYELWHNYVLNVTYKKRINFFLNCVSCHVSIKPPIIKTF